MRLGDGTIGFRPGHRQLELARQELEFRVVSGPLAQQLGRGARVFNLVRGSTSKMVRRHVADRVARGLDRMHAHIGQRVQHVRDV